MLVSPTRRRCFYFAMRGRRRAFDYFISGFARASSIPMLAQSVRRQCAAAQSARRQRYAAECRRRGDGSRRACSRRNRRAPGGYICSHQSAVQVLRYAARYRAGCFFLQARCDVVADHRPVTRYAADDQPIREHFALRLVPRHADAMTITARLYSPRA